MKKMIRWLMVMFVFLMAMFIGWLSYAQEENATILKAWSDFKSALVWIAWSADNIEKIERADTLGDRTKVEIQAPGEIVPVYARYDEGTIYYHTVASKIYLNPDSKSMFSEFRNLREIDMTEFDTSKVTTMQTMFNGCRSLTNLDLSNFVTSGVTNMKSMFNGCSSLTSLDLSSFDTRNVTDMSSMFLNCSWLELDLSNFNTSNVTTMQSMFNWYKKITDLDLSSFDTSKVTNMSNMFMNSTISWVDLSSFDTTKVTNVNVSKMFNNAKNLKTVYASDLFNVETATTDSGMFLWAEKLEWWNWTKVSVMWVYDKTYAKIDRQGQLWYFTEKPVPLDKTVLVPWSLFNTTLKNLWNNRSDIEDKDFVDDTIRNFEKADELTTEYTTWIISVPLSKYPVYAWYDDNDETIYYYTEADEIYLNPDSSRMFHQFTVLENINTSEFNTSEVENMRGMFNKAYNLETLDLSNFDTSNVTTMQSVFNECKTLKELDLRSFDTSMVENMQAMFNNANNLETIYVSNNFSTDNIIDTSAAMFLNNNKLVWGNWTKFSGEYSDSTYARIDKEWQQWYFTDATNITVKFIDENGDELYTTWIAKWNVAAELTSDEIERETGHALEYYADEGMTEEFDFNQPITKYTEIYTQWTVKQYHIAFVDRKWEVVSWADYNYGTPKADIVLPEAPEREWYGFSGWAWIPETMPAENVTWTAEYNVKQYTITFVKWNWEPDEVITDDYGTGITAPADPTREWYTFKWRDKPVPPTMPAENVTITAKWEEEKQSWGWNSWWYSWWWGHSHDNSDHGSAWDEQKENNTQEQETTPTDNQKNEAETQGKDNTQNATHEWSYKNWLTKYINASDARLGDSLTRSEMAKLASIFATKVLWETPDESKQSFCSQFADISKLNGEMGDYVIKACELWYMWYQSNGVDELVNFRPYSPVTVAEASVIVSRMMWWNQNASSGKNWYKWHLYAAYNHWLLDDIRNPYRNITRWEAFEMFYRTSQAK